MIPSSEKISKLLEQFYTDHDPEAFNALFSIFRQRVAVYIVKEFPQLEEEKEDILQEVALDLSRILTSRMMEATHFHGLLFVVIRRRTIDHIRKSKSKKRGEVTTYLIEEGSLEGPIISDDTSLLARILTQIDLPVEQKVVMWEHDLLGRQIEEIAQKQEINLWTARSRLRLARDAIRAYLRHLTRSR